jgi:hypothetical protein
MSISRGHKVYFLAVGLLAVWVGVWSYFIPTQVDAAIPWLVPPLHARFLGAMYLSGATAMALCVLASRWAQVRVILPMIAIWTGMLFVISLWHLPEFNFARPQPWVWFGAYLLYPFIALWFAWQQRAVDRTPAGAALPKWASVYMTLQGVVSTVLGLALLFAPGFMVAAWPWQITSLLAQLYAAPFLSYGLGSFMLARSRTWSEVRIASASIMVFAAGALLASVIHRQLFSTADVSGRLWFGGWTLATLIMRRSLQPGRGADIFFETMFILSMTGETNAKGEVNLLQLAVIGSVIESQTYSAGVPIFLQRLGLPVLAAIGRLMGYRARYSQARN